MKSAKLKPIESDEPGPWKHAPRPKVETVSWMDVYRLAHDSWLWPSGYSHQCRDCSHEIYHHWRGLCEACKHECGGTDALHDELMPLMADARRIYDKHAKMRQRR